MKHVSATEAKAKFSELLTAVEQGEAVNITRHGKVIARLMPDESVRQARIDKAIERMRERRKRLRRSQSKKFSSGVTRAENINAFRSGRLDCDVLALPR